MEKFKAVVSRIEIPDGIAIDALRNTLWVRSKFREDLYENPTTSLQDAIARSDNFIRMEEDTNAILSKMNTPKAPAPKNGKSWSKNKERRAQRKATGKGRHSETQQRDDEEDDPKGNGEGDSSADEEKPANRRRIEVILSQQTLSSNDENDDTPVLEDLRDVLKRKFESEDSNSSTHNDLRTTLDARKFRRISTGDPDPKERPNGDLRDKLNAGACDLCIRLNRSKSTDLQRRLEQTKTSSNDTPSSKKDSSVSTDLRAFLDSKQVKTRQQLNVIMGASPPCGNSVRSVKDYRRQVATSQRWPTRPPSHPLITFSPDDAEGIYVPHNDPLLVVLGIGEYDVTKVLVDTGSSVDLIFRGTLQKMGVDLDDIKPSSRTLTGFNGSSETILGTIRLPVCACGVTRTVKFTIVSTNAPYHAILGTPLIHSMQTIPSTYHQCVKFPGTNGKIKTLRGDQKADRELLVTTVKLQRSSLSVNFVSPLTSKVCSQEGEVLELPIDDTDPSRTARIGAYLSEDMQQTVLNFLKTNVSTFAWSMSDMKGIDPAITTHELNVDPTFKPIRKKRRKLGPDRSKAENEEVDRLLGAGSIAKVRYPEWLANPVVVKNKNGKWRICVDFTDLNKACPKDSYPLPNIDRLVESTAGNEMLTFMDTFSGYNQIMMHPDDREKTAFITDRGTYCYKVMPFGLKNAGATYQRLVNNMFADKLGVTMEVYIDDMLVKSLHATDHLRHLQDCFETLNKYGMKLNPAKGTSTDKCLPFYDLLRGNKRFIWDEKCEEAFTQLKHYLTKPPVHTKPDFGDVLSLYVAVSQAAVRSVLIKEDRGEQKPIFYISRHMNGPETRYPTLEKMVLAVVEAARKLRPYFQSHSVEVLTDQPLQTILQNTNRSGRLTKWAIELGELDITYKNRTAAKSQVLADFLVELAPELECRSSTTVPTGELIRQSFSFGFPALNNEAEYESLIAGLRLAKAVKAKRLSAYCDLQLVASQFSGDYDARNDRMDAYLKIVQGLAAEFEFFELVKVPRGENVCADALAALGSKLRDQVK
ncbi:PREDICTED: uncharacterized protein LOC106314824 [Brassica oleracea var. oleracea]|uniref:uncharacterized protein LOC106314824 n=1 Tax=Brassica oleracea var. oleracea TaxID=109376 RepID=UPI0006A724CA|nr:PREDICTED: uncharacterized protein LOC106314824 [Brassica oleracea var. oleracea]